MLVKEFGEEKGKELGLKAIRDYGIRTGEKAKAPRMCLFLILFAFGSIPVR